MNENPRQNPQKLRVAAYCRVSTEMEAQESSMEWQQSYYKKQIEATPQFTLAGIYGDKGASGRSITGRKQFQRLLRDCEAGEIDVILTKSISRFARSLPDCVQTIRRLQTLGISVRFEKEGIDTLDAGSELLLNVLAVIAEEESVSLSQNMRWSHERRNAAGNPFIRPPFGYWRERESGGWRIHTQEGPLVQFVFAKADEGWCYREILRGAEEMERGLPERSSAIASNQPPMRVCRWNQRRLIQMLRHEGYIGDVLTNKTYKADILTQRKNRGEREQYYIEGHHEPLVSRAVFQRVQRLLERRLLYSRGMKRSAEDEALPADENKPV